MKYGLRVRYNEVYSSFRNISEIPLFQDTLTYSLWCNWFDG